MGADVSGTAGDKDFFHVLPRKNRDINPSKGDQNKRTNE
jgi:hypothetical protein